MRPVPHYVLPFLLLAAAAADIGRSDRSSPLRPSFDASPLPPGAAGLEPEFSMHVVAGGETPMVHSATGASMPDGSLVAAWYGGTAEGHSDVRIFTSRYDPRLGIWSPAQPAFDPPGTAADLGRAVSKLGNPVLMRHPNGSLWMFYVSVSVGGWSGSSINLSTSADGGQSWSPARRLITSPLLNMGNLVRSPPVMFDDGRVGLPIYHEMINRFSEFLVLSENGDVMDKHRMSPGPHSLQPAVIPFGDQNAAAFFRSSAGPPGFMLRGETRDGGGTWSTPVATGIPNRDAGFAVLRLSSGDLVSAYNNSQEGRVNLYLASSNDRGVTWNRFVEIEGEARNERGAPRMYSYPQLIEDPFGYVHLLYTWDRQQIRHARFSESWLSGAGG